MQSIIQRATELIFRGRHRLATAAVGVLLCLLAFHAIFGANGFLDFHQKTTESQKLDQEIRALEQDNARRQQEVKALKSEPQAIEKEARERMGYARPGEVVYTVPARSNAPSSKK
jgi:cell division protein FtsB